MNLSIAYPWVLLLLPLMLLPLLRHGQQTLAYSSELLLPADPLSSALDGLLRGLAAAAIGALVLGLAGLFKPPQAIERIGQGAQMVLLLDRSSSMDRLFAGSPSRHNMPRANPIDPGKDESKAEVARRLLSEFTARRNQDMFGMLMFSTNPIQVLPLTAKQALIQAAIQAGSLGRGLAKTNLGSGLVKALEFYAGLPYTGSIALHQIPDKLLGRDIQARAAVGHQ